MSSDGMQPFEPDEHTVALYHFDEGRATKPATPAAIARLTLRSRGRALWGRRPGFGSTARFERSDSNIPHGSREPRQAAVADLHRGVDGGSVGSLHRPRRQGPGLWARFGGDDALLGRYTYAFLCGTDEEGFSLPSGMRAAWSFYLNCSGVPGTLEDGLMPGSRLLVGRAGCPFTAS